MAILCLHLFLQFLHFTLSLLFKPSDLSLSTTQFFLQTIPQQFNSYTPTNSPSTNHTLFLAPDTSSPPITYLLSATYLYPTTPSLTCNFPILYPTPFPSNIRPPYNLTSPTPLLLLCHTQPLLPNQPFLLCPYTINPLTPISDRDRISPYNINTISTR